MAVIYAYQIKLILRRILKLYLTQSNDISNSLVIVAKRYCISIISPPREREAYGLSPGLELFSPVGPSVTFKAFILSLKRVRLVVYLQSPSFTLFYV